MKKPSTPPAPASIPAPAPTMGRPPIAPEEILIKGGGFRMTKRHWSAFAELGGAVYLRAEMEKYLAKKERLARKQKPPEGGS